MYVENLELFKGTFDRTLIQCHESCNTITFALEITSGPNTCLRSRDIICGGVITDKFSLTDWGVRIDSCTDVELRFMGSSPLITAAKKVQEGEKEH